MTCEEYVARFEREKERGKYLYFSYGMLADFGLEKEFKEQYDLDVVVVAGGDIGSEEGHCFNQVLLQSIEELEGAMYRNSTNKKESSLKIGKRNFLFFYKKNSTKPLKINELRTPFCFPCKIIYGISPLNASM